jgi:pyrrolidone-carboxylate peptidase
VETTGRMQPSAIKTNYEYHLLIAFLQNSGFKVKISNDAGNYLCNHVYFHGLQAAEQSISSTKILFLHVPVLKNFSNKECFAAAISKFLRDL